MEAVNFLSDWTTWLLVLIPVGAGAMITYQAARKSMTNDASIAEECNLKINNTLKGAILGTTMASTITVIKSFYGY